MKVAQQLKMCKHIEALKKLMPSNMEITIHGSAEGLTGIELSEITKVVTNNLHHKVTASWKLPRK